MSLAIRFQATAAAESPAEPHTIAIAKSTPRGWPQKTAQMGEDAKASLLYLDLDLGKPPFLYVCIVLNILTCYMLMCMQATSAKSPAKPKSTPGRLVVADGVTEIANNAYRNRMDLREVWLPDSVVKIGYGAFRGSQSIGDGAFSGCTGLVDLRLPDTLQSIGHEAFKGCTGLVELHLPVTLQSIGHQAFYGCTGIVDLQLPDTLQSIGFRAFCSCTSIVVVHLPATLQSVVFRAFRGCTGIVDLHLPATLQSIGEEAFYGCTGIVDLQLPDTLQSIGEWAFDGCTGIVTLQLPDTL